MKKQNLPKIAFKKTHSTWKCQFAVEVQKEGKPWRKRGLRLLITSLKT